MTTIIELLDKISKYLNEQDVKIIMLCFLASLLKEEIIYENKKYNINDLIKDDELRNKILLEKIKSIKEKMKDML